MKLKYPVKNIIISKYYKKGIHNGIDLTTKNIEENIYAPADGIVVGIRNNYDKTDNTGSSYGNYIKIKHKDNIYTLCAHLKYNSIPLKIGDTVKEGEYIGIMGNTGYALNTHLHYEVIKDDNKVDPLEYTCSNCEQNTSEETIKNIKSTEKKETETQGENINKQIQELQDKISLQTKEIEALKQELQETIEYKFTYPVQKTSKYEIKLNEGETLYIK